MRLIDKSALVAEIEKRIEEYKSMKIDSSYYDGMIASLEFLRDEFINTLEVKEVDLNEEFDKYFFNFVEPDTGEKLKRTECWLNIRQARKFAKHFFELGMQVSNKAQKGEEA